MSPEVGGLPERQPEPTLERSDVQGIEITDSIGGNPGDGEGTEAGVAIMSLAFAPILSGLEVVVNREDESRPFKARLGDVIAATPDPHPKVPPEPLGAVANQALVVVQEVNQGRVEVKVNERSEILPPEMSLQLGESVVRGEVGGRIEDGPNQADEVAPKLTTGLPGDIVGQAHGRRVDLDGEFFDETPPEMEDTPLMTDPSEGPGQVRFQALGPVAGHASHVVQDQARFRGPLKEALPSRGGFLAVDDHRWPNHPAHAVRQEQDYFLRLAP